MSVTKIPTLRYVRKAAVLGAGVMGAQIAAHLANADVEVLLFELAARDGDPNANALKAIKNLSKLRPAPFAARERASLISPANYEQHLEQLRTCDLIIEAIAERIDLKQGLYVRVTPYINEGAIFATNTSGISINRLAEAAPESLRPQFCGTHFFNPPRYMPLVEVIPGERTHPQVLDFLETFLTTTLGKGVIRAKDTPSFVANRIGVTSMMAIMHHAERFGLALDLVDALTGPAIGRPKSATFRTADVIGLDTFRNVWSGSIEALPDDPWVQAMALPGWLEGLIEKGALGQKSGAGIYRRVGKETQVLDPAGGDYRPAGVTPDEAVAAMLKLRNPAEKFAALRASDHPQAQLLWAAMRDLFHYAAVLLAEIADNARDLDLALRWGYGWSMGPLETWQAIGWKQVAGWIEEDIAAGKTLSAVPLPAWVREVDGVHRPKGSYSAAEGVYKPRSELAVYRRQAYPETVLGEARPVYGETVFENDGVRLWDSGNGIPVLSFKSKLHVLGEDVVQGMVEAVAIAERDYPALVIWQTEPPFSAGANLKEAVQILEESGVEAFENMVTRFQQGVLALKYASVPVVAAVQGIGLGGGCEVVMHCARVVAALESYLGLVEVGVGLLPAGGGCKELAQRAALEAAGGNLFPRISQRFQAVSMGKVSQSAEEARQLGYLRSDDVVVFHPREILHVAKSEARALAERGYRPTAPRPIKVAGSAGIANLQTMLVNMREGGFISDHDVLVSTKIAEVLCGGTVDPGTEVSEAWLLGLERKAFVALVQTEKTRARIEHMLKTGKPLRN